MISLSVNSTSVIARFDRITAQMRGRLVGAVNAAVIELQGYIKSQKLHGQVLNSRSGNLSRAITVSLATDEGNGRIVGSVGVDRSAPYGRFQEYGVAHSWVIKAKNAKALRFSIGGANVFARSVTHPGLKERSFMRSALADRRAAILERLHLAVREGIK